MIDDMENLELELGVDTEEESLPEAVPPKEDETPAPDEEALLLDVVPDEESLEEITEDTASDSAPEGPEPVEVISVDELLERLTQTDADRPEEAGEPEETQEEPPGPEESPPILGLSGEQDAPLVVEGMEGAAESLEALQDTIHPALTTPFSNYTVTEALLLLLLLFAFLSACFKLLRGAFVWLRS